MSNHPPRRLRRHASYEKAAWVSEIQDKGDLFYVEKYVDGPSSVGHSNGFDKQTMLNGQARHKENGTETVKDKRLSSNKLFELIPRMKKNKKPLDFVGGPNNHQEKCQDIAGEKGVKKDVKLRVNPPRIGPYKRDDLESVLGIIPYRSKMYTANGHGEYGLRTSQDSGRDGKIVIAGFTPTGPAIACHDLEIGDTLLALNGLELNLSNANAMLGAIPGVMEVTLRIQKGCYRISHSPDPCFVPNDNHLMKIISGKTASYKVNEFADVSHGVMYLSLDVSSEDEAESDILFQFPKDSSSKNVVSLRGIFLTLADMLSSVTGSTTKSTSVVIDGKLVHIGYQKFKQEIFVLALPANSAPLLYVNTLMENLNRLLCLMFGSLHRAFCDGCNMLRLEHFFSLIFEYILGSRCIFSSKTSVIDSGQEFLDCLEGVRWLDLPSESKVHIDTCLNELEANDCAWTDELFTTRRKYLVLGSCLFYKGVLIGNHLPTEDLVDIALYCRFHCLFTTSEQQRLSQLVIWREIFLTRQMKERLEFSSILNVDSRSFLLIVGLKHCLFCIILEAGVISQRANGNPGPDPYYIDQAKNILIELEHLDIPSVCEARFQNPSHPLTVVADHFLLSSKTAGSGGEKLSHESKTRFPGSVENLRSPGIEETESIHSEASAGNAVSLPPYTRRRNSNASEGSKGSTGSGGKILNRNLSGSFTLATLRKHSENIGDLTFNYLNKLSAGAENTVFHYVTLNRFHGIIMSPFVNCSKGRLHDAVLENFNKACLKIRRYFLNNSTFSKNNENKSQNRFSSTSPDTVIEMGIQFCVTDNKRHEPSLKYWVKGRLLESSNPKEFYVCYQDSAGQNAVELAFKLGFGSPL